MQVKDNDARYKVVIVFILCEFCNLKSKYLFSLTIVQFVVLFSCIVLLQVILATMPFSMFPMLSSSLLIFTDSLL